MTRCPKGHKKLENEHYRGERGAPVVVSGFRLLAGARTAGDVCLAELVGDAGDRNLRLDTCIQGIKPAPEGLNFGRCLPRVFWWSLVERPNERATR